jgi:hypothetical protein
MKPLRFLFMILLMGMGATAMGQRLVNNSVQDVRQRLNTLQLTIEQKRRLVELIRRERMQFFQNQKELNNILTDKQKAQLLAWRNKRLGNVGDSAVVR